VLGFDRLQEFLRKNEPGSQRHFYVLVVKEPTRDEVVGATVFSYVPATNCGFSEYILVDKQLRSTGVGRLLFETRKEVLDVAARRHGTERCHGLFIEVEHPERTPPELLAAERETALDAWQRWRIFDHLGFRRVALTYVQPPLAADKSPVDYLDLMFLPWDNAARASARIPAAWVLDTLLPSWVSWAPDTYGAHYDLLQRRLRHGDVELSPLLGSEN